MSLTIQSTNKRQKLKSFFQNVYKEEAKKTQDTDYTLPVDIPEIELSKQNAKLISDVSLQYFI